MPEGPACQGVTWQSHLSSALQAFTCHICGFLNPKPCRPVHPKEAASSFVCASQESDAQLKAALQTAQADLDWVVSELKAGKLSPEEAEDCIKGISDSAPTVKAAMAELKRAESRGSYAALEQESAGLRGSGWSPKKNESVRLLKFGGKIGKVSDAHTRTHILPLSVEICCLFVAHMDCHLSDCWTYFTNSQTTFYCYIRVIFHDCCNIISACVFSLAVIVALQSWVHTSNHLPQSTTLSCMNPMMKLRVQG